MKRSVFIIIGVVLVLVLVSVWVYVLFFSTPSNGNDDEQFGDLNFQDTTDSDYQEPVIETEPEPVVDVQANQRLRQLTTRQVAGYREVQTSTSSPREARYMEVGTGHIYAINLSTGEEKRISGTTITGAQVAEFSENGQYVMIQTGFGAQKEFVVGEISLESSTLSNTELAEPITSFSSTKDNRFLYSIQTTASTIGKVFDPAEYTNETLFTIPFREASVEWGSDITDSHYAYPKAARELESFLFRVKNGVVTRMPIDGYGMSAIGNDNYILYSKQVNNEYRSYYYDINLEKESIAPLTQIPEKCAMSEGESPVTICANTEYEFTSLLPDSWYKGETATADSLWEINSAGTRGGFLINPELSSGRVLNISRLQITAGNSNVYFTNQSDQTLWMYQRITADVTQN